VLLQGYPNLEYIIIDGGSTDNSVDIIRKYEPWLTYWVSENDAGQTDAIQKGFRHTTGHILAWLNSDDLLLPNVLQQVAAYFCKHENCHFLTGDGEFVSTQNDRSIYYVKAGDYSFYELLLYHQGKYLPQPAVFFSRQAYLSVGGLHSHLHYTMDLDFWLRLRQRYTLHYLPACLAQLRFHADAKTWRDNSKALQEAFAVILPYLSKVSWHQRINISNGFRTALAQSLYRSGLAMYFSGKQAEAADHFGKAIRAYPISLYSKACIKLLLRLVLPAKIKRHIFQNP